MTEEQQQEEQIDAETKARINDELRKHIAEVESLLKIKLVQIDFERDGFLTRLNYSYYHLDSLK